MGRELQKKKNRSSIPKQRQKPKSKKLNNPRSNAIIAANWDKSLSLAQNYRNLGLTSRLNHRTGGVEKHQQLYAADGSGDVGDDEDDPLAVGGKKVSKLAVEEVSVERDPETGRILKVIDDAQRKRKRNNPLNDPLNDIEDEFEDGIGAEGKKPKTAVVRDLESLAARGEEKRPRKQSKREQEWIERLVQKHGQNYRAMSRDMKLNPMQQSEGDIRARIRQWKTAQGGDMEEEEIEEGAAPAKLPTAPVVAEYDEQEDDMTPAKAMAAMEKDGFDDTKPRCTCSRTWKEFVDSRKAKA